MADSVDNYLGLTHEDLCAVNPDEVMLSNSAENVLKDFRSLDCTVCAHHFGFQHRFDPRLLLCSPRCLAVAKTKLKKSPSGQFLRSQVTSPACPLGAMMMGKCDSTYSLNESYGNALRDLSKDPRNFMEDAGSDRWQAQSGASSRSSSRTLVNGPSVKREYANVGRDTVGGSRSLSDAGTVGSRRSTDETDLRAGLNSGGRAKENSSGFSSSAFKPVKSINSEEEALHQARQNARLVKPVPLSKNVTMNGTDTTDAAPAPRPLRELNPERKTVVVPTVTKPKVENRSAVASVVNKETVPERKTWVIGDVIPTLALGNEAPCLIAFTWKPNCFTINAAKDAEKIQKLDELIAQYSETAAALNRIPKKDDVLLAPYDGLYYRCKVDEVLDKKVKVTFVDYGDSRVVDINSCKDPSAEIMQHPIYGVIFTLTMKEECPEDLVLPPELEAAKEKELLLRVDEKKVNSLSWGGYLKLGAEETLNELLEKYIRSTKKVASGAPNSKPNGVTADHNTLDAVASKQNGLQTEVKPVVASTEVRPVTTKPVQVPVPGKMIDITAPKLASAAPAKTKESVAPQQSTAAPAIMKSPPATIATVKASSPGSPKAKNPFGGVRKAPTTRRLMKNMQLSNALKSDNINGALVHVNFAWNYGKMSISSKDDDAKLEALSEIIQNYAATAPGLTRKPEVDEILIAPYSEAYYRGKVTNIIGDQVTLEFVDYGDMTTVAVSECKELTPEINAHPIYGTLFYLADIPESMERTEALDSVVPIEGQVELFQEGESLDSLRGRLWLDGENNWNDTVKEAAGISD